MALGDLTVNDFRWFRLGQAVRRGARQAESATNIVTLNSADGTQTNITDDDASELTEAEA